MLFGGLGLGFRVVPTVTSVKNKVKYFRYQDEDMQEMPGT